MSLEVRPNVVKELQNTHELCQLLLKTPHYAKMGPEGIFAVVETAKSLGIDPRQALGGGLYYVKGKVEMSARMMNSLIRAQKHSITRDPKSNDEICILHGRRADNGDTWTESFSMEDAKRAGLTNNSVWKNFSRDMLFARALSRLARQLFPDVIGNVYVEGEISLDSNIKDTKVYPIPVEQDVTVAQEVISPEQEQVLLNEIGQHVTLIDKIKETFNLNFLNELPVEHYEKVIKSVRKKIASQEEVKEKAS